MLNLTINNIFFSVIFFFFIYLFIFSLLLYELYNTRNLLLLEIQKNEMLEKKLNQIILEIEHIKSIIKNNGVMDDTNLSFWQSCPDYSQNYLILAVIGLFTLFFIILTFIYLNSWWCGIPLINSSNEFISSINNLIAYINRNLKNYFDGAVPVVTTETNTSCSNLYTFQDYQLLVCHKDGVIDGISQGVYVKHNTSSDYESFNCFLTNFENTLKVNLEEKILGQRIREDMVDKITSSVIQEVIEEIVETDLGQTIAQTIASDPVLEAITFFGKDISTLI